MKPGYDECNFEVANCVADKEIEYDEIYNFDETCVYYENPPKKIWVPQN